MGVEGLWKLLPADGEPTPLFKLASERAFNVDFRLYKLGIDASLWTYHAQAASGTGENAEIELIFHRCCRLLSMPVAPLFVFDGPDRPKKLRNEKKGGANTKKGQINESYYLNGIRGVVAAFGFETLTAPGEAEATLAQLNSAGIIDAILSDDVDCFVFGAKTVLRNVTIKNSPYGEYVNVYSSGVLEQKGFYREELVFIALLSGGDYDRGLPDCGITTASQLRFLGFGKALRTLDTIDPSDQLLSRWRDELRMELETNLSGALGQRKCKAAGNITSDFPRREVVRSYFHPSIFNHAELVHFSESLWQNKLELRKISATCETYFMWSSRAGILRTFERHIWPGVFFRLMVENAQKVLQEIPIVLHFPLAVIGFKDTHFGIECYQINVPTKWFISHTIQGIEDRRAINLDTVISPFRTPQSRGPMVAYDCREAIKIWFPKNLLDYLYPEVGPAFFKRLDLKRSKRQTIQTTSEQPKSRSEPQDNESIITISSDSEMDTFGVAPV